VEVAYYSKDLFANSKAVTEAANRDSPTNILYDRLIIVEKVITYGLGRFSVAFTVLAVFSEHTMLLLQTKLIQMLRLMQNLPKLLEVGYTRASDYEQFLLQISHFINGISPEKITYTKYSEAELSKSIEP
jgi:hypothetical protein